MTSNFEVEVREYELEDCVVPPPPHPILFVGSSSIRFWEGLSSMSPGLPLLNRGFGGSQMTDLLHYFPRLVLRYHPGTVFVYEGDNDLAQGRSVDRVAGDFETFLQICRRDLPDTRLIIMAVKPSPIRRFLLVRQRELNERLRLLADSTPDCDFLDTFSPLLDEQGEPNRSYFRPDGLHLNSAGYEVWGRVVADFLNEFRRVGEPAWSR